MRRFLLAFAILSVIVLCQNVTTGTSIPVGSQTFEPSSQVGLSLDAAPASQTGLVVGGKTPEPVVLLLMVTGLSGLAVAGNRRVGEPEPARV